MTFDIHQMDEIDDMSEEGEEEFNAYRDQLAQLFSESPEGQQHREKYRDSIWWADMFMDLAFRYLGESIPSLDVGGVDELVTDILPRKVSLQSREEALDAIPELLAFWSFLRREYQLGNASEIIQYLESCSPTKFADSMLDASKAGLAKSFFLSGQNAGFDMTDKRHIDEYMLLHNAGQVPQMEQEQKTKKRAAAKEKQKRKAEKAARKRNRKR